MTITVVATLEASNAPPRVRLDVTSVGGGNLQATVTRLGADGRTVPVRTADGNPLPLTVSGSDRVGLAYDYEAAYGTTVQYGTGEFGPSGSPLLVDVSQPWLIHVGIPTLSQPVTFGEGSFAEELLTVSRGVFRPLGRSSVVVVTDGARKDPQSSFTLVIETLPQIAGLKALLKNASPLLLNIPVGLNTGVDTDYISVGDVPIRRLTANVIDTYRLVPMPYDVVDRPAGGSQSQRTYADVLNAFATYADVLAAYSTYAELLAPTL